MQPAAACLLASGLALTLYTCMSLVEPALSPQPAWENAPPSCTCTLTNGTVDCRVPDALYQKTSLAFVPALGDMKTRADNGGKPTRFSVVDHNAARLNPQNWCCVVLVYRFYDQVLEMQRRHGHLPRCSLLNTTGNTWMENLRMVTPDTLGPFERMMVFLDDIEMSPDFDLDDYDAKARASGAEVTAPSVYGDDWYEMQVGIYPMPWGYHVRQPPPDTPWGWRTAVYEPHMAIYSKRVWGCIQPLISEIDHHGWGYLQCMPLLCNITRQAIIANAVVVHRGRDCCTWDAYMNGFPSAIGWSAEGRAEGERWLEWVCRETGRCITYDDCDTNMRDNSLPVWPWGR